MWPIAADVRFLEGIVKRRVKLNPGRIHANPYRPDAEPAAWYKKRYRQALERIRSMSSDELAAPLTPRGVAEPVGMTLPAFQSENTEHGVCGVDSGYRMSLLLEGLLQARFEWSRRGQTVKGRSSGRA